jgi:hypothetical protein
MSGWTALDGLTLACALIVLVGPVYLVAYFARLSR